MLGADALTRLGLQGFGREFLGGVSLMRNVALRLFIALTLVAAPAVALAGDDGGRPRFRPGAAGLGDPYYPLDGNGGYDVKHYLLDVVYNPTTDLLTGVATIRARATQNLSSFNFDFDGLNVQSIEVDGDPAGWERERGELTVTPRRGLRNHKGFTTVVQYRGVPEPVIDEFGVAGFLHTDDGALVIGQPHVAATWFPANDHPLDKAAYTFRIGVPRGLEAVANGILQSRRTEGGRTTWTWQAKEPMAPYLTTATMGEFDLRAYRDDGIRFWDAIDPDLFAPPEPRTGDQYALSQAADSAYKRLTRTISVPSGGAELSFWVTRDTESDFDFMFVEAHTVGMDDWTTLPDLNGHNSADTGFACPFWLSLHPFLTHYQTDNGDDTCSPTGTPGEWWAASGSSDGYEQWKVNLDEYAGTDVEVSISYASDESVPLPGLFVDDVVVSNGPGTTSFEDDGNELDGWTVSGPPEGSPPNPNDWIVGTSEDAPPTLGEIADGSLARQGEIIDFLSENFGAYPFSAAGGIVDDYPVGFALEIQTRPIYDPGFFFSPESGDGVIVHELAHQWYGDSVAVASWQHIWLNEGFATYAEWLWSEREGLGSAQEIFDLFYSIPEDDPFWALTIGDPGPGSLFDFPNYARGAMTLHQLRLEVGDKDFFRILRRWARSHAGGNVTTAQFIRLAERVSDQNLNALFNRWLFKPTKPNLPDGVASSLSSMNLRHAPPAARSLVERLGGKARFASP